jgi:hypothetical protein
MIVSAGFDFTAQGVFRLLKFAPTQAKLSALGDFFHP